MLAPALAAARDLVIGLNQCPSNLHPNIELDECEVVQFTWEVGRRPKSGVGNAEMYRRFWKLDVIDDKTLTLHDERLGFTYNGINDFRLLPAHLERPVFEVCSPARRGRLAPGDRRLAPRRRRCALAQRADDHRRQLHPRADSAILALATVAAPPLESWLGLDATAVDLLTRLESPTFAHPLGTGELGRDVLARLLRAGRVCAATSCPMRSGR